MLKNLKDYSLIDIFNNWKYILCIINATICNLGVRQGGTCSSSRALNIDRLALQFLSQTGMIWPMGCSLLTPGLWAGYSHDSTTYGHHITFHCIEFPGSEFIKMAVFKTYAQYNRSFHIQNTRKHSGYN
jgi:hypothetical protein